ncbi:TPA_asm: hypothetical protein [Monosiga MELD virus 2]|nr:TPA_asm: hypothetical protein [Monosiga MELD virus 2]
MYINLMDFELNDKEFLYKGREKEYMRQYMKSYFDKRKIECECGCSVFPHALKAHLKTKKHNTFINLKLKLLDKDNL